MAAKIRMTPINMLMWNGNTQEASTTDKELQATKEYCKWLPKVRTPTLVIQFQVVSTYIMCIQVTTWTEHMVSIYLSVCKYFHSQENVVDTFLEGCKKDKQWEGANEDSKGKKELPWYCFYFLHFNGTKSDILIIIHTHTHTHTSEREGERDRETESIVIRLF